MRILLTTTSYQDTPGKHHDLLKSSGHEIVRERGPLDEATMLKLVTTGGGFDGLLHGDDALTRNVIAAALPRLRCLSKYGIGLDSVDVKAATEMKVPVLFTPGVNHTTVAENTFGLMITLAKRLDKHIAWTRAGGWKRETGTELAGKTLGILGMGRVGQEVAKRGRAFGMEVVFHSRFLDPVFAEQWGCKSLASRDEVIRRSDILCLHLNLSEEDRHFMNRDRLAMMKKGAMIVNAARGGLVDEAAIIDACTSGRLRGYATDVMEEEPMKPGHPFTKVDNILITPHIGSRTFESVERQALMATENLLRVLRGEKPLAQANEF